MKALLTGGTGFIGSHTAVALLEAGNEVMLYDNLYNSSERVVGAIEEITGKKPGFMKGDIRDEDRMKECFTAFR
ncbi:MAG: SDR family NAD(P)-dependent oxidoreductase, partial [Sutterellaceae bacterium]|nr:SDR family NAD(P)-dependent oxidoreductase [Sutterellaceae bacterium]